MKDTELIQIALMLTPPWKVAECQFDVNQERLNIHLDFLKGVEENLPNAAITFDKFHVLKGLDEAVDEVRRQELKGHPELKNSRYVFLKNTENLTDKQVNRLEDIKLKNLNLKTIRAYQIRLNFQELWLQPPDQAEAFLKKNGTFGLLIAV
jgi:hypothetical protein